MTRFPLRPALTAMLIACMMLGAIGVTLAEAGLLRYTDARYAAAENLLVIAACLTLALVVWRQDTSVTAASPSTQPDVPVRPAGRLFAGTILAALTFTGVMRAIAPGNLFLTAALMPIMLFILPGLPWIVGFFGDQPRVWRAVVTPALSLALWLIAIAWMTRLGIPLSPASLIGVGALLTLSGLAAPLLIRRLRVGSPMRAAESERAA